MCNKPHGCPVVGNHTLQKRLLTLPLLSQLQKTMLIATEAGLQCMHAPLLLFHLHLAKLIYMTLYDNHKDYIYIG